MMQMSVRVVTRSTNSCFIRRMSSFQNGLKPYFEIERNEMNVTALSDANSFKGDLLVVPCYEDDSKNKLLDGLDFA